MNDNNIKSLAPTNYGMMPNIGSISPKISSSDPSEIIEYSTELTYWSRRTKDIEKYNQLTIEQRQAINELNQKILDVKKLITSPSTRPINISEEIARSKPIPIPPARHGVSTPTRPGVSPPSRNSKNDQQINSVSTSASSSGSNSKSNSRRNSGRLRQELSNKIKHLNSDEDDIKLGLALMKAMKYLEEQENKDK